MRVLITGAKGQLGQDLTKVFSNNNEVAAYDIDELDITDLDAVKNTVKEFNPKIIINAAAYTNVDGCESDLEAAFKVNALASGNLAKAAALNGAEVLYVSTDYVFDGTSDKPYLESDAVNPEGAYGRSKLEGEQALTSVTDKYYITRTAWLYGHGGSNFVKTIQNVAKEKGELKVVDDQRGSPTYTLDLAQKIKEIVENGEYGTYHVTNSGSCTWYEFAKELLRLSGIDAKLTPCDTEEFPRPAKRPAYSVLANEKLSSVGISPMRPWKEAIKSYFEGTDDR